MNFFYPVQRLCVHIPGTGPEHDRDRGHLHIIINDPTANKDNLLVGICSLHDRCDVTCVLESGHKFIRHKSFVFYAKADVVSSEILIDCVKSDVIRYEGLFDEAEFARVKDGFLKSPHTRPKIRTYFEAHCA